MADSLLNITRHIGANPVGVTSLRLFLPEDVASAPRAYSVPNLEGDITLTAGKTFYSIEADPRSVQLSDELRTGIQGDYYQQAVSLDVRRLTVNAALLRARLRNRRVHCLATTVCGLTHYFPNMRLRRARAENPGRGYQGTRLQLESSSAGPAVTLNGQLLDDTPTEATYIILEQPTTGQKYRLAVGGCGELITVPIVTERPAVAVSIDNYTIDLGELGGIETNEIVD